MDDSGYLHELIEEIKDQLNVDCSRVHLFGYSNGGFMAYRMACDYANDIAAIASLAGATFDDPADCNPSNPVHVLEIHGTADTIIDYDGGNICGNGPLPPCTVHGFGDYPGAIQTVEYWAGYNECLIADKCSPLECPPLDLNANIPGNETTVARYDSDCAPGGSAELWTMASTGHLFAQSEDFSPLVIQFLLSHSVGAPDECECPADFDFDGTVGASDLAQLLGSWGPYEPCPPFDAADFNEDCGVNAADLAQLLGAWGPCP